MISKSLSKIFSPGYLFVAAFAVLIMPTSFLFAQPRFITVDADASVMAKPDQLKFLVTLIARGKTVKEAKKKQETLRSTFRTAFNVMKIKGLSMTTVGKAVGDPGLYANGGPVPMAIDEMSGEEGVYLKETVELVINGFDKLDDEKVEALLIQCMDELKKLKLPMNGGFSTSLANPEALKEKALTQAMASARKRAESLAKLSGGKIGRVMSVEQTEFRLLSSELREALANRLAEAAFFGQSGDFRTVQKVSTKIRVKFELMD